MHGAFDRFAIWLEEVPEQACYCAQNFYLLHNKAIQSQKIAISLKTAENECEALLISNPRPATRVTFRVDPDCAVFCKECYPNCLVGI